MGYMLKSKNMQLKIGVEHYTGIYGSSYLAGFFIFFHGSMEKLNQLAKKKLLKIFR